MPIIMPIIILMIILFSAAEANKKNRTSSSGQAQTKKTGSTETLSDFLDEIVSGIRKGSNKNSGQSSGSGHQNHIPVPPAESYRRTSAPARASQNSDMGTGKYDLSRRDDMGTSVYPGERDIANTARTMIFSVILASLLILYFLV